MASKAVQEKAVGEGLAIACHALGIFEVPSQKQGVEFAFERAWDSWAHKAKFPQVRVDIERNVILNILHDSDRRTVRCAEWKVGQKLVPVLLNDWTVEELGEHAGSPFGLVLEDWLQLGRPFLAELGFSRESV